MVLFTSNGGPEKERTLVKRAAQRGLRGLVLIPTDQPSLLNRREVEGVHLVALHRPVPALPVDSVLPQDRQGARLAGNHLVEHGFGRILFVSLQPDSPVLRERVEGYRDAMEFAALSTSILEVSDEKEMAQLLTRQLKANRGSEIGVVTKDVNSTLVFLRARRQLSLGDRDRLRLVALDDFPTSDLVDPPLTTVRQPLEEMSILAVDLLLARMESENLSGKRRGLSIPVELMVRGSCGCVGPAATRPVGP